MYLGGNHHNGNKLPVIGIWLGTPRRVASPTRLVWFPRVPIIDKGRRIVEPARSDRQIVD